MVKAVIFDMDGVLIDSEPLWYKAEVKVYKSLGFSLTPKIYRETVGMRYDLAVRHWFRRFCWKNLPPDAVQKMILKNVKKIIIDEGKPKSGVIKLLQFLEKEGLKIALASSSPLQLIKTVLKKLKIRKYFNVIHSGESELNPKPHPDIFLSAAKQLGVKSENCLVIEDSIFGILAAKRAAMKCLVLASNFSNPVKKKYQADFYLKSLLNFDRKFWIKINNG